MSKKRTRPRQAKPDSLYKAACKLRKVEREKLAARLLSKDTKEKLAIGLWSKATREELGLTIPVTIYAQDPLMAKKHHRLGLQDIKLKWELGLMDGPTSGRLAIVDYDSDTNVLAEPARWDGERWCYLRPDGKPIMWEDCQTPQFHQVSVWGVITRILDFFDDPTALGRPVPWAFEGNRLIVVPHAGYGENAFYDRHSKSLQFYYCGTKEKPVYTCLSHDIVAHETGHAVLDGIRPYYNECSSLQTAAFHEFVADMTAILSALCNTDVRRVVEEATKGNLTKAKYIANLAEEFGLYVADREYLRTALNKLTMKELGKRKGAHHCSQVLSGAMFEIMAQLVANYMQRRGKSARAALWNAVSRFTRVALQPLDYCPPVDIQFEDYACAVLRRDQLSNPRDPYKYRQIMRKVFKKRQIPHPTDEDEPDYSDLRCYNIGDVSSSRTAAYHFVHRNRESLHIPVQQDIVVVDPYYANKVRRTYARLPREIVLQYIWHEGVELKGSRFGRLKGETVSLLCGGTLVYDDRGNLLYWCRKPGTEFRTEKKSKRAKEREVKEMKKGEQRRKQLLDYIAYCIERGMIGVADEGGAEGLDIWAPIVGRRVHGTLCLEATPHLRHWGDDQGGQR